MDVKLGELPQRILMRDFTPKGTAGAFQRDYYHYHSKYIDVKMGNITRAKMGLAAYMLFSYCLPYKGLKREQRH
uniref:ATP synthase F(0) complex subunit f, mitochondrial n=1 Tax=Spermophilus dauricus TaxID=99837 RepID=A0A8C9QSB1_SPEDA